MCGTRKILPESYRLLGTDLITSSHPVGSGAVADIYEGTLDGRKVCVKRTRACSNGDPREVQGVSHPLLPLPLAVLTEALKFYQEAVMWRHGRHPNIVPFRGVTVAPLQLILDWVVNGNVVEYIKAHPGADRLALVCSPRAARTEVLTPHQLRDITEGLKYLHSRHVVHGNLKGVCAFRECQPSLLTSAPA